MQVSVVSDTPIGFVSGEKQQSYDKSRFQKGVASDKRIVYCSVIN